MGVECLGSVPGFGHYWVLVAPETVDPGRAAVADHDVEGLMSAWQAAEHGGPTIVEGVLRLAAEPQVASAVDRLGCEPG